MRARSPAAGWCSPTEGERTADRAGGGFAPLVTLARRVERPPVRAHGGERQVWPDYSFETLKVRRVLRLKCNRSGRSVRASNSDSPLAVRDRAVESKEHIVDLDRDTFKCPRSSAYGGDRGGGLPEQPQEACTVTTQEFVRDLRRRRCSRSDDGARSMGEPDLLSDGLLQRPSLSTNLLKVPKMPSRILGRVCRDFLNAPEDGP